MGIPMVTDGVSIRPHWGGFSSLIKVVAEGGGFEPPVGFDTLRQFSKLLV